MTQHQETDTRFAADARASTADASGPAPSSPARPGPARSGPVAGPGRRRPWLFAFVVVALLTQMAIAMVIAAVQQTPTIDEPVYVGAAVIYLEQHSLRYNPEHPPLGKLIMGIGLAFTDVGFDPGFTGDQTMLGRHILYQSGNDPGRLMLLARLPIIVLTLLFGLVVCAFATDLLGPVGGLAALALYSFSPDVIAHGSLATLDVPAAGFLLTSVWLLWRARPRPLLYLPLAGLAFGAAVATKMSMLAAAPVVLLLVILAVWHAHRTAEPRPAEPRPAEPRPAEPRPAEPRPAEPRPAEPRPGRPVIGLGLGVAAAVGVALLAIVTVWVTYLAVDPRLRWATPATVQTGYGLPGQLIDWLPLPKPYRDGMLVQLALEEMTWGSYLLGRSYRGSLWYYLPAAMLIKTPLGMLALWLAGVVTTIRVRRLRPALPYLLAAPAVLLVAAAAGSRNFGVRYVVFVPMFLAIVAAAVVTLRWRWARLVAALLVVFVAVSSLRAFPYHLPYSNEAFGGPAKTHLHLHDSNVDWGQDLGRLAAHLRSRYPGERVWLLYKGSGYPPHYGIRAGDPLRVPPERVSGLLVVSNSWVARPIGNLPLLLRTSTPIDQVGHSITIFRRTP